LVIDKEKILGAAQKFILKGQSKKAIKEILKLIEASPKDKRLYLKLGDLYLKDGESDKAIKEYLRVAELYEEEDLNFRAISIYKRILSINPKHIEAIRKIAKLYVKEGLVGSAKSYYQNLLEIKPDDKEAQKALEEIEKPPLGKEEKHKTSYVESPATGFQQSPFKAPIEEKVEILPPPTIDSSTQGFTQIYETEIPPPDKDAEMHYHLGIAYKEMELFDYAITEFETASSNPPMKFDCYIMLGSCYMEKGDFEKSIEYYKKASQIQGLPKDKLARLNYHLGLAYEANGMLTEAIDTYSLVLKLDQSFSEAHEKIKKLQPYVK